MTVRCSVSTDQEHGDLELDFAEIPRAGEALDIAGPRGIKPFVSLKSYHRVGSAASSSILLLVTSRIS